MIYKLLRKLNRFIRRIIFIVSNLGTLSELVFNPVIPENHSAHAPAKSRTRIYFENLWWMIRFGEVNRFYYLSGFHLQEGPDQGEYLAYRPFLDIRNEQNRKADIGNYFSDYTCLLKDKLVFNRILTSLGFPTPRVIVLKMDTDLYRLTGDSPENMESLLEFGDADTFILIRSILSVSLR